MDKQAWKQLGGKTVDVGKYDDVVSKLAAAEATNQRLQGLLEKEQSEVAEMLIGF